ncbi:hypothetical protein [Streptomyces sp. NPDC052107]|uniref:hypothetical protein n=1 Tax=Streptomyces sp. NPDC052107 TaxID=3155632 RepID=UPI0034193F9C
MLGIAVPFYGCAAAVSHFWVGQSWSDALPMAVSLGAACLITLEVLATRDHGRTGLDSR